MSVALLFALNMQDLIFVVEVFLAVLVLLRLEERPLMPHGVHLRGRQCMVIPHQVNFMHQVFILI
jgi:hypothetical protein